MTRSQHLKRHRELHGALDELLADFLTHHRCRLISSVSLMEFLKWSASQLVEPTVNPGNPGKRRRNMG